MFEDLQRLASALIWFLMLHYKLSCSSTYRFSNSQCVGREPTKLFWSVSMHVQQLFFVKVSSNFNHWKTTGRQRGSSYTTCLGCTLKTSFPLTRDSARKRSKIRSTCPKFKVHIRHMRSITRAPPRNLTTKFNSGSLFQLFTKISTHENNPLYGKEPCCGQFYSN